MKTMLGLLAAAFVAVLAMPQEAAAHHKKRSYASGVTIVLGSPSYRRHYSTHNYGYHTHCDRYHRHCYSHSHGHSHRYRSRTKIIRIERGNSHVRWCYNRYRSYRASDNTFQPYHGPRKACRSPYWR